MRVGSYCRARSFPVVLRVYGKRSVAGNPCVLVCVCVCGFMHMPACVRASNVLIARPGNSMGESKRSHQKPLTKDAAADCLLKLRP